MKKYSFILLAALALGFTACEDGPETAQPQSNPQPEIFQSTDVVIAPAAAEFAVSLADITEAGATDVCLGRFSKLENLAPGYKMMVDVLYATECYEYEDIDEEGNPVVQLLPLEDIESITVGNFEANVVGNEIRATVADLQNAYLDLYGVSNEENDVYLLFAVSTVYSANKVDQEAFVDFYSPMTLKLTPDFLMTLYVIQDGVQTDAKIGTDNGKRFQGFVYINGNGFKLGDLNKGVTYGMGDVDGEYQFTMGGADNVTDGLDGAGLYYIDAQPDFGTIVVTRINTVAMIGGFNNWGGDLEMAPVAGTNDMTWTVTATLPANDLWKFRMNSSWSYNLGGEYDNLVPGGANLIWPADGGEHTVTLYLGESPIRCTID